MSRNYPISRRAFTAGMTASAAAAALPMPALSQTERSRVLKFTPATGLSVLDPSVVYNQPSNSHSYHVFDTLYAVDGQYRAQPQMAEGHTVSDDQLTWDIKLRDGLRFHDGEPVLARDCVASIKRWWVKDLFGQMLSASTAELSAADDRTIRFRLNSPFGVLPAALGRAVSAPCAILPERLADPDPTKLVTEMVGSGPLRFVADEFVPGQRAVYERNPDYVPRSEPAENTAGGKVMHFDRVEWNTIADFATAAAALQAGETDWWEVVHYDLVELMRASPGVKVEVADPSFMVFLRFNSGIAPFNNPELRRIVASAISQRDLMTAMVGAKADLQRECYALFNCSLDGMAQPAESLMSGPKDFAALAERVKAAGYNGERIVLFHVVDVAATAPLTPIIADVLGKIGINVDMQSVDLTTWIARRASQEPLDRGGWSMFLTYSYAGNLYNPGVNPFIQAKGTSGYAGNYDDQQTRDLIDQWVAAPTAEAQMAAINRVQERVVEMMPTIPLGQLAILKGLRADLVDHVMSGVAVPWNVRRA